jgi:two-component system response regulator DesR
MAIRAIAAGDDALFLDAVTTLMLELEGRLDIVGWADDEGHAATLVREVLPDLALVSAESRFGDGVATARRLLAANPTCRVVLVGSERSPSEIERGLSAGAAGYVTIDPVGIDLFALALSVEAARWGESRLPAEPASYGS